MIIKNRVQEIVNSISQEFHQNFAGEAILIWFGSWIKGDAYLQSDIDLAIKYEKRIDSRKIVKFRHYLDSLPTLYKIELIDMDSVGELLKSEIDRYGKIL